MSGRAPFVVLEGIEGAGKSTQLEGLARWLGDAGVPHARGREPGDTPVGEAIREILLGEFRGEITDETELFLMLAARAAFVRERVRPALERGRLFLADRHRHSTLAYQGHGRGLPLETLRDANELACGDVRPDLVVLLDVDPRVGLERHTASGRGPDRIEAEGAGFLRRVRDGYLALAEEDASWAVIDASAEPEAVARRLRAELRARFPETFESAAG